MSERRYFRTLRWMAHILVLTAAALSCCAEQAVQQNDPQPANTANHRRPIQVDPAYSRIANETGGQVYVIDPSQVDQMAKLVTLTSTGEHDPLLSINDTVQGERTFHAEVDGDVSRLVLSVTGTKDLEVRRPNGSVVGNRENVVQYVETSNGSIYSIDRPEPGSWRLLLRANGSIAVRVSAVRSRTSNSVQFDRFEFVEVGGRPGHEGMFPIQGYPLAGREADVEADLDGEVASVHFEFRSPGGQVLKSFRLHKAPGESQEYGGRVTVPEVPFVVYAVGVDMRGARFQRLRSAQVNPQWFRVSAPRYWEIEAGRESAFEVEVTNWGPPGSFAVVLADVKHLVRDFAPKVFQLDKDASIRLKLLMYVPSDGVASDEDLVVSVQRAGGNQNNFALIRTSIRPQ